MIWRRFVPPDFASSGTAETSQLPYKKLPGVRLSATTSCQLRWRTHLPLKTTLGRIATLRSSIFKTASQLYPPLNRQDKENDLTGGEMHYNCSRKERFEIGGDIGKPRFELRAQDQR